MDTQTFSSLNELLPWVDQIQTPALIIHEPALQRKLRCIKHIQTATNCKMLYAMKPLTNLDALKIIAPQVTGLATSSLFEAMLARNIVGKKGTVHITSPGFRPDEIDTLAQICDYIVFNSVSQYQRFQPQIRTHSHVGLRINPELSFVADKRYDPCRLDSKLGVPLTAFLKIIHDHPEQFDALSGLQCHNNCDSTDFAPLLTTVEHLIQHLGPFLQQMQWFNMGGGYLFTETTDYTPLYTAIDRLQQSNLTVYFEPGATYVREAGFIVATVIDLFEQKNQTIAILDTTINHMQEVYEYQFSPTIYGHDSQSPHAYLLAGCTCLAGDLFGQYRFQTPLTIGSKIIFMDMGAYTQVKSHMFNGVNLPSLYGFDGNTCQLRKTFTFEDFLSRC